MNKVEFVEQTFLMLAKQGKQSKSESGACVYRGPGGLKCAAGLWLMDGTQVEEGIGVRVLVDRHGIGVLKPDARDKIALLAVLQSFHDHDDNWRSADAWIAAANVVCVTLTALFNEGQYYSVPSKVITAIGANFGAAK